MSENIGVIHSIQAGKAVPYTRPGTFSAIDKQVVQGAVRVDAEGLQGDEQGDHRVHGGPDKAVHCYAWSHYARWQAEWPANTLFLRPAAFGENFSVIGPDEWNVCLGDHWRIGTALFEVSQGRQPCWKLNDRFGISDMARRVQDSLYAGWYLRVLEPGVVEAGDWIVRSQCPYPDWPLARLLAAIRDRSCDPVLLRQILALPLPASWQRLFSRRLESGQIEVWESRLDGRQPTV